MTEVSRLSSIHPSAKIGEGVIIEPFVFIEDDVEIGDGTWIGSNAVIRKGARIGKNCKIFPGAVIASIPQDMKFKGEHSIVEIGNNVSIREFCTINRGTVYSHKTVIGDHSLLMAYTHVAHDCVLGKHVIIANAVNLGGHVIIDDYSVIGGLCAVHQFTHVGKHTMIAGGSLLRKDIPPFTVAGREPPTFLGVNKRGLGRRGFAKEVIKDIQDTYRIIYLSGLPLAKALAEVEQTFAHRQECLDVVNFIRNTPRGVMRGYTFVAAHSNGTDEKDDLAT